MTEEEAKDWVRDRHGTAGVNVAEEIVSLVQLENAAQNLVAPSTIETMWNRHIVDSAQLLNLVPDAASNRPWVDVGSGAGFPGLVIAALGSFDVRLVEPRRRRATFLQSAADALRLTNVEVICGRIEQAAQATAAVISARAVAQMSILFEWAETSSDETTRWVLPKGRGALEEIAVAKSAWRGVFHVEHSVTDPTSLIVLASGVARR